jgi:hypothetical protein
MLYLLLVVWSQSVHDFFTKQTKCPPFFGDITSISKKLLLYFNQHSLKLLLRFKETVAQDFLHSVFSSINPIRAPIHGLKPFPIWLRIRRDNRFERRSEVYKLFLFKVKRWYVDAGIYLWNTFAGYFLLKKQFFTISLFRQTNIVSKIMVVSAGSMTPLK